MPLRSRAALQGKDAAKLDSREGALWRRQALDWLGQDLAWWSKQLDSGNAQARVAIRQRLAHWQADPDLAGVRAQDRLNSLPAEERRQCRRLWSDVDALLRRVDANRH